ncbi:MAG: MotA/TolQ/ExbB proton channel family protein [Acidobacteriota bacterium]
MNFLDLFSQGGWIMWPLLLCSLLSVAITIERLINLRPSRFLPPVVTTRIETLVEARAFSRALELCRQQPGVFPNVIRAALEAFPFGREAMREATEAAGRREIPRVGCYLGTLGTIASIAPLLGLLGTVLGMIQVFTQVARQGLGQAASLSSGISMALVTTAFGLIIAIPTLVMYNVFSRRAETIVLDIESRVLSLTNRFYQVDGTPVQEAVGASGSPAPRQAAPAEV